MQVRWFELPAVMIFHVANAWQEGEHVVKLFACCFTDVRHVLTILSAQPGSV